MKFKFKSISFFVPITDCDSLTLRLTSMMDSDDEKEAFEVTDYDLANEFNINRPQGRQTKAQAIYGKISNLQCFVDFLLFYSLFSCFSLII